MSIDPATLTPRGRRAVLGVAIGAAALDTALIGLIAPLLPEIESRTGASPGAVGVALAAYAFPILVLSIPLGRAADALGRRRLLVAGLLLTAAGSVLIAASHSLAPLIAGRVIQGIGATASWIAALALVAELAPPGRRGEAIGFALAANSAGAIAGPALGGVTAGALGFEAPFLIVAGLGLGLAGGALAAPIPPTLPHASTVPALPRLRAVLGAGIGLWSGLLVITGAASFGLIEVVAPLDTDRRLGLSAAALGLLFAAAVAVDGLAAPIGGRAGDRRGRFGVAILGLGLSATSFLLFAILPGTVLFATALIVYGAGVSLVYAAAVPWLDEAFGDADRGLAYGALNLVYAAGYVAGPAAGGLLFELAGARAAYLIAAMLIIGLGVAITGARRARPEPIGAALD